jgi:DNA-directed RNA polymerase specialized sigma24 family protein
VPKQLGIDLAKRGHEVAKLLYSGFSGWIHANGYEFEDVLQEVFRKILVANQGKSPWTPEKSKFGHYVHMVCRSALSNYHRKVSRVQQREVLGVVGVTPSGQWGPIDVADHPRLVADSHYVPVADPAQDLAAYILGGPHRAHPHASLAAALVPHVQAGRTLKEVAGEVGATRLALSKARALLRTCASEWASI